MDHWFEQVITEIGLLRTLTSSRNDFGLKDTSFNVWASFLSPLLIGYCLVFNSDVKRGFEPCKAY